MKNRTILVTMDFNQDTGFFLKESLVRRLESLNVSLRPLTYDLSAINRHLQDAAGLIIPGGIGDVDPGLYGEDCHAKTKTIASRSHFEMRLLEKAIHDKIPFLGICWGMQMANVFLGGSLIQDIASQRPDALPHASDLQCHDPGHSIAHAVTPSERMRAYFGLETEENVNSTHHQAVGRLGDGLQIEAQSPDGIVEAASLTDHDFFWLVQWHPERLNDDRIIPRFLESLRF